MKFIKALLIFVMVCFFAAPVNANESIDFEEIINNQYALDCFECAYIAGLLGKTKLSKYLKYEGLLHINASDKDIQIITQILAAHAIGYWKAKEETLGLLMLMKGEKGFDKLSMRQLVLKEKCAEKVATVFEKISNSIEK